MAETTFFIDQFTGDDTRVKITMTDVSGGVQVKVDVIADPVSGYSGDLQGVFFHIGDESLTNTLSITGISGATVGNTAFGTNSVSDITGTGGNASANITPAVFDFGVTIGAQGGNPVETTTTFLISSSSKTLTIYDFINANPDGAAGGPGGYDIGVRLQSTTGPEGSSKLVGEIPPPVGNPPVEEDGLANTPGFWKQSQHFAYWVDYAPSNSFASVFGLGSQIDFNSAVAGTQGSLLDALSAGGGGVNALGRAGTAALLNAASDPLTGINYIYTDNDALEAGLNEVFKNRFGVPNWTDSDKTSVLATLDLIDLNDDGRIGVGEVKNAVQDAFGTITGPLEIGQVAIAFDVLNNMPSLEVGAF
jgi:hypothetical protein